VVVVQRGRLRALRVSRTLATFHPALLRVMDHHVGARRIRGMIEKTTDVVHKEWVQ
jgi:hypothetical protein